MITTGYHNIGRVVIKDGWNILSREGIGCITDEQACFTWSNYWSIKCWDSSKSSVTLKERNALIFKLLWQLSSPVILPTAPSPTTTHLIACIAGLSLVTISLRNLQTSTTESAESLVWVNKGLSVIWLNDGVVSSLNNCRSRLGWFGLVCAELASCAYLDLVLAAWCGLVWCGLSVSLT